MRICLVLATLASACGSDEGDGDGDADVDADADADSDSDTDSDTQACAPARGGPCGDGYTCAVGEVCVERQGGAQIFECAPIQDCPDGCGSCDCLCPAPWTCNITAEGILCDTCTEGPCP
jgi:hypothetical protein